MADREPAPPLQTLDLSLQVLEALDGEATDLGVSELARRVGASKAAVYRILTTFARRGYVTQNPTTAQYAIGPRLRRFSYVAAAGLDLQAVARPYMTDLRDATGDTVHLAVLDGGDAIYIAKEDGLQAVQVVSRVGARCPAHCVATGKALLAFADEAAVQRLLRSELTRYTPLTNATPEALQAELQRVRTRGCAINRGEWRLEVRGVAAPIFDNSGRVVAALGVCSPASRLTDEHVPERCTLTMAAAEQLSARLGWRPEAVTQRVNS